MSIYFNTECIRFRENFLKEFSNYFSQIDIGSGTILNLEYRYGQDERTTGFPKGYSSSDQMEFRTNALVIAFCKEADFIHYTLLKESGTEFINDIELLSRSRTKIKAFNFAKRYDYVPNIRMVIPSGTQDFKRSIFGFWIDGRPVSMKRTYTMSSATHDIWQPDSSTAVRY